MCNVHASAGALAFAAVTLAAGAARAELPFEVLHSFQGYTAPAHARYLTRTADGTLYGSADGGGSRHGVIFKMTPGGALSILYEFPGEPGGDGPGPVVFGADGLLYGTAQAGDRGCGIVFRLTTAGTAFTVLHVFQGGLDGCVPNGSFFQSADGNFYGTTSAGGGGGFGSFGVGTVFRMSPAGTVAILHAFAQVEGNSPKFLVDATDGNLYGAADGVPGGPEPHVGWGTIFRLARDGTFTIVHSFDGIEGALPDGLVQGIDGNVYGVATSVYPESPAAFRLTMTGSFSVIHRFSGGGPTFPSQLVASRDGNLYGVGSNDTLFRMGTGGDVQVLRTFDRSGDGAFVSSLFDASDGLLYGSTSTGGAFNSGTLFSVARNGTSFSVLHTFVPVSEGARPSSSLIAAQDGAFYGTTSAGGRYDLGTTFRMTREGVVTTLHEFAGGADGAWPAGPLIQTADGTFYGATSGGGAANAGTIFRMSRDGALTVVHAFPGGNGGASPTGIVHHADGYFYGATTIGGASNAGTIFRMTPGGDAISIHDLAGGDGVLPSTPLIVGADGALYGTAVAGGPVRTGGGTMFRVTGGGAFTLLHAFTGGADGAQPIAPPLQASNGFLYLFTSGSCEGAPSSIVRVRPDGSAFQVLANFPPQTNCVVDEVPLQTTGLTQGADGNLYGLLGSSPTLFRIIADQQLQPLQQIPVGSYVATLLQAADGNLYGLSPYFGTANSGMAFRVGVAPCSYVLSSMSAAYDAAGGVGSVRVDTASSCPWTAASSDGFIAVTSGASGRGSGTVAYSVSPNSGLPNEENAARQSAMTIGDRAYRITQSGCIFSIDPTSTTYGAGGGAGIVTITTPAVCSWTTADPPSWATTRSGANGTGSGIWQFTVDANGSGSPRQQSVAVAGHAAILRQFATPIRPLVAGRWTDFSLAGNADERWTALEAERGRSYCARLTAAPTATDQAAPQLTVLRSDGVTALASPGPSRQCFIAPASETLLFHVTQLDAANRAYRFSVAATTVAADWFFIGGDYSSFTLLRNTTADVVHAMVTWRDPTGAAIGSEAVTLQPGAVYQRDARAAAGGGPAGSVTVAHDGEPGAIVGSQTTLSGANGLSFDALFQDRGRY